MLQNLVFRCDLNKADSIWQGVVSIWGNMKGDKSTKQGDGKGSIKADIPKVCNVRAAQRYADIM